LFITGFLSKRCIVPLLDTRKTGLAVCFWLATTSYGRVRSIP